MERRENFLNGTSFLSCSLEECGCNVYFETLCVTTITPSPTVEKGSQINDKNFFVFFLFPFSQSVGQIATLSHSLSLPHTATKKKKHLPQVFNDVLCFRFFFFCVCVCSSHINSFHIKNGNILFAINFI